MSRFTVFWLWMNWEHWSSVQSEVLGVGRGLEQRAGGAAGQRRAVAVRRARAHRQQVVVARDVAVPGQVVRVLRVSGNHHGAGTLDDTDGWFWERKTEEEVK